MSFCQVRDKTAELASRLMERCLNSTITLNNAIDVLEVLQALTSEIISVQTGYSYISKLTKSRENRKTTLESFLYSDKYTVHWFEEYGFGLRALVPIEEGYKLIRLPRRSVFCLENSSTILKEFIAQDTLASNMENIALCLCLLGELYQGDESAWQDYIKTLPSDYPTFLYMNAADIRLMKGSPVIGNSSTCFLTSSSRKNCIQLLAYLSSLCILLLSLLKRSEGPKYSQLHLLL